MGRAASTILDYRTSAAVQASKLALGRAVRHRENAYQAGAWSMLIAGLGALLLGPLLVAGLVASIQARFNLHHHHVGYWMSFALASMTLVPLLFWFEHRSRGQWFEGEMRAQGTTLADLWQCSSRGEWALRRTAASWAAIVEILLWGPRMIMNAHERFSGTTSAGVINEAIATINYLRHFDGGVGTDELPTIQPLPVLRYLLSRDWVGVSKSGDRVWLLTDARRALAL